MNNNKPLRVLFVCRHNAIRSQLAAAWLNRLAHGEVIAESAGLEPQPVPAFVQSRVALLERRPVLLRSRSMQRVAGKQYDCVIRLCDKSSEQLPMHPCDLEGICWDFIPPANLEQLRQMEYQLMDRLKLWLEVKLPLFAA
ncbi:arsenate reductase/protein-tyrosine-phosphatase family protein [Marinobacterium arenosum]|uniref:arsenate reductase/protein-tyrosine-phosphatase family protein n=1 Tax=Marinobacterium arenosum TaxID=2862496 RepID=UPI001C97CA0B|nr:hypothetical protein [Marinobacterium arenosum]MBY4676471.1 hypothetical protein [Marinobacterium arenosum]